MVRAYVGLGANLGDAAATLDAAVAALDALPRTRVVNRSPVYRTAPVDAGGPDYLNAVAAVETGLSAPGLLAALLHIETENGRLRPYPNAPRTLDLDLLLHGDACLDTPTLTVPHPRLHLRAFVLVPLADVAPELVVPGRGAVTDLLPGVAGQRIERVVP